MTEVAAGCDSVARACNAAVSVLHGHTGAAVDVLLLSPGQLSVVAFSGAWQAPAAVPSHYGVVGHVLATGRPAAIDDASIAYAGLHTGRPVGSVVCAPLSEPSDLPIGVLNIEFDHVVTDPVLWADELAEVGRRLRQRIDELGGPPAESREELLLRHTLGFATAHSGVQLAGMACRAAIELTGLGSATVLTRRITPPGQAQHPLRQTAAHTAAGACDLPAQVTELPTHLLSALVDAVCRHGASRTLGDPSGEDVRGFEPLVQAGVRTLLAFPVRGTAPDPRLEVAMLVMDELEVRVDPGTVTVLELLMANAAECYDRLGALHQMQALAETDPLTGLRHVGPFTEQLAAARIGRTALLVIDVDNFKQINDRLGHAAGDKVLVDLATGMRECLRKGDELFRVGGDEFVAIVDVPDDAEAVRVADRLVAAARDNGSAVSVGVALRRPAEPAEATLRRADLAMYSAKQDTQYAVCSAE
ncbi:GGDEF domain-containing protein [Catellatospora sichuanensis]|uniref:GGDEF domain-containing protein n=1 Tax=Catellatospora sichuanensis TaxID=1969805 RepID=UPI0011838AB9|nr:GGDEF domain-containing protein [Catellatospora sichuanensis]